MSISRPPISAGPLPYLCLGLPSCLLSNSQMIVFPQTFDLDLVHQCMPSPTSLSATAVVYPLAVRSRTCIFDVSSFILPFRCQYFRQPSLTVPVSSALFKFLRNASLRRPSCIMKIPRRLDVKDHDHHLPGSTPSRTGLP